MSDSQRFVKESADGLYFREVCIEGNSLRTLQGGDAMETFREDRTYAARHVAWTAMQETIRQWEYEGFRAEIAEMAKAVPFGAGVSDDDDSVENPGHGATQARTIFSRKSGRRRTHSHCASCGVEVSADSPEECDACGSPLPQLQPFEILQLEMQEDSANRIARSRVEAWGNALRQLECLPTETPGRSSAIEQARARVRHWLDAEATGRHPDANPRSAPVSPPATGPHGQVAEHPPSVKSKGPGARTDRRHSPAVESSAVRDFFFVLGGAVLVAAILYRLL